MTGCAPGMSTPEAGALLCSMTAPDSVARRRGSWQTTPYRGHYWWGSVVLLEGRALGGIAWPWAVVMACTAAWSVPVLLLDQLAAFSGGLGALSSAHTAVQVVLSFLLVFRLNRSAERYWAVRQLWGKLVEVVRQLSCAATTHLLGSDAERERDALLAWCCAFGVTSKCLIRSRELRDDELAGILTPDECALARAASNPPLFCASGMRRALARAVATTHDARSPSALQMTAVFGVLQLRIDELIGCTGGMERIKSTPLPVVYVSHLRTFLLGYLLLMPLVYIHSWKWGTLPAMALVSFAFLGVEGAAHECEAPFEADHVNHLAMDKFAEAVIKHVESALTAAPIHARLADERCCKA